MIENKERCIAAWNHYFSTNASGVLFSDLIVLYDLMDYSISGKAWRRWYSQCIVFAWQAIPNNTACRCGQSRTGWDRGGAAKRHRSRKRTAALVQTAMPQKHIQHSWPWHGAATNTRNNDEQWQRLIFVWDIVSTQWFYLTIMANNTVVKVINPLLWNCQTVKAAWDLLLTNCN